MSTASTRRIDGSKAGSRSASSRIAAYHSRHDCQACGQVGQVSSLPHATRALAGGAYFRRRQRRYPAKTEAMPANARLEGSGTAAVWIEKLMSKKAALS